MITKWTKRWSDGRTEHCSPDVGEVDSSRPEVSVIVRKLERKILANSEDMGLVRVPSVNVAPWDYRALSVKTFRDPADGKEYVYMVYATEVSASSRLNRRSPFIPRTPYALYFAKYDIEQDEFVTSNVQISDLDGVNHERCATINMYDDGKLWVSYMDYNGVKILSKTSSDGGATWGNKLTVLWSNTESVWQEEDQLTNVSKSGDMWFRTGYTSTATIKRAYGDFMLRSAKQGQYIEFDVVGTEVFLYTYSTLFTDANGPWCGIFKCWIDNQYQGQWNLHRDVGYRHEIKLNKNTLPSGTHRVRLQHVSGLFFFVDAVRSFKPAPTAYILCDSTIRRNSGQNTAGIFGQEAVMMVTYNNVEDHYKKRERILVENSGESIHWGSPYVRDYWFNNWDTQYTIWGRQGHFHEDWRGLWVLTQVEENTNQMIKHWLWKGKAADNADYSAETWSCRHTRQPTKNKFIRFTAGSANKGGFVLTCINSRGVDNRDEGEIAAAYLSFSQDLEFSGVDFELSDRRLTPYCAFNFTPDHETNAVGLFCVDDYGFPYIYSVSLEETTAQIANVMDYVSELEVEHSASSEPSSMRMTIVNTDNVFSTRDELALFFGLLPSNYFDKALREVVVIAKLNQGAYSYETTLFRGILGEVVESYSYGVKTLSISAFDYAKWLQNFYAPYYLVYANPPLDWAENAQDYPVYFEGGSVKTQEVRSKRTAYKGDGDNKKEVVVGWENKRCWNMGNFIVDVQAGVINQTGPGMLVSPFVGNVEHNCNCEFTVNSSMSGCVEVGMTIRNWNYTSSGGHMTGGTRLVCNLDENKVQLYIKEAVGHGDVLVAEKPFIFRVGTTYRVFSFASDIYFSVEVYDKYHSKDKVALSARHNQLLWKWGLTPENMYIKCDSDTVDLSWDNIYMSSMTRNSRDFKTDKQVALDIVSKAFQGILELKTEGDYAGDYFTGIIMHPERSASEGVEFLAMQNGSSWYFDYDGSFVWDKRPLYMPVSTLTDDDIVSMELSFNPLEFRNWVEVAGGEDLTTWVSYSDYDSVIRDGIRYTMVNEDEVMSTEHAAKLSLSKFYEKAEAMEELSLELSKPWIYLQPRDVIRVDSSEMGFTTTPQGYTKLFYINSTSINFSDGKISVSLSLSSRIKAMIELQGTIYSEGGVEG